ncbi:MAG: hypothetical protein IJA03_01905 [Bacteroidaceae bacterium]|nr:hypothetical protein [Bacteroidaceae bacterium]
MAILKKDQKYKWQFENIGGCSRVKIATGQDIAHLDELDTKMWTVLSCPVKGLEIDEKSLRYVDLDADGKIRVNDVVGVSQWATKVLKNPDLLLPGNDAIDIEDINVENEEGQKLAKAAKQILANLGKEETRISLADTADIAAIFAKTRFNGDGVITPASSDVAEEINAITAAVAKTGGTMDRSGQLGVTAPQIEQFYAELKAYSDWCAAEVPAPFGDKTDAVIAAYQALDAKMKDFFMRNKLAKFSPDSTVALDVQTSRIEAISAENLSVKGDEIAAYPIARITGEAAMDLTAPINPAWAGQFKVLEGVAIPAGQKTLSEEEWAAIGAQFAAYTAWKGSKAGASVEDLTIATVNELLQQDKKQALLDLVAQDASYKEEADNIEMVDKFLHILRDFYRLLKNFITFHDFYNKEKKLGAIFQSGTLIIDQRACRFCMKVENMPAHNATAATSGLFLVYCDCTTKTSAAKMQIVAAITVGEIGNLIVGKNALYYDNAGVEWDAVITKVVDNPISVAQAFWSPYRRMSVAVENLISKSAAEKDSKMMADATAKINAAPTTLPATPVPAAGADAAAPKPAAAPPFDIAKFAGIFAAIGMAVGMIGTALASLAKGLWALTWWQLVLVFLGLMMLISGPAMVLAWLKLRRRNIAPLLNANGWAVNAASKISIPFGETLTDVAKYPKLKMKDPYAKKGMSAWAKVLVTLLVLAVIAAAVWYFKLYTYVL